ncbi:arad-like aldolase/epimerase [Penicillium sp. IBT 16267x]|nr:arad-like aldolase/epimerase [Penicillium sp. IBT 16267x]
MATTTSILANNGLLEAKAPSGNPQQDSFFEDVHFLGDKEGRVVIRSPPKFEDKKAERTYQKQHLAAAFRVFAKQGFDEGVAGHISQGSDQPCVSDLVLVNESGEVLPGGAQHPINGPAFAIHSEIHKARPDLNAACHAHSIYGKAFSCYGRPIEMLYQDALRFYNDLAVYNRYGGTVISTKELVSPKRLVQHVEV